MMPNNAHNFMATYHDLTIVRMISVYVIILENLKVSQKSLPLIMIEGSGGGMILKIP